LRSPHYTDGTELDVTGRLNVDLPPDLDSPWFVDMDSTPDPHEGTVITFDDFISGLLTVEAGDPSSPVDVGACFVSTFISPAGVSADGLTCSDASRNRDGRSRYVIDPATGEPVYRNATVTNGLP
jgi:hypothetical protein